MEGILSQEEIDALLGGGGDSAQEEKRTSPKVERKIKLTKEEEDAIGELGNISLGTSATTLSTLLGKNVSITTPKVEVTTYEELKEKTDYAEKVILEIEYKAGFSGLNILLIEKKDAIIIGDLMMGNDGYNPPEEIDDLYLSAIGEAMNQMMGSSSTSIANMIKMPVDINPPNVSISSIDELNQTKDFFAQNPEFVTVTFDMEIEGLIKTNLFQIMDIKFVKDITKKLYSSSNIETNEKKNTAKQPENISQPQQGYGQQQPDMAAHQNMNMGWQMPPNQMNMGMGNMMPPNMNMGWQMPPNQMNMGMGNMMPPNMGMQPQYNMGWQAPVNVQPVQFASFGENAQRQMPSNIDLIMDVQLQVTVELGRTKMQIKEILDLGPGSIVELEKLAGEPVDIFVNSKLIAKGEVVVIDESFGVRITDIVSQMERLSKVQ